jgi:ABC-type dipeptide/oligopeptide/nickel transport system ATPase component
MEAAPDVGEKPRGTGRVQELHSTLGMHPEEGCAYRACCPASINACSQTRPVLKDVGEGHMVACTRL